MPEPRKLSFQHVVNRKGFDGSKPLEGVPIQAPLPIKEEKQPEPEQKPVLMPALPCAFCRTKGGRRINPFGKPKRVHGLCWRCYNRFNMKRHRGTSINAAINVEKFHNKFLSSIGEELIAKLYDNVTAWSHIDAVIKANHSAIFDRAFFHNDLQAQERYIEIFRSKANVLLPLQ